MSIFGNNNPISQLADKPVEYEHKLDDTGDKIEATVVSKHLDIFLSFVILSFAILVGKLFLLQAVQGSAHLSLAEGNRIRVRLIPAPRGIIYDRNGKPLVTNVARYDLAIIPADLPKNKDDRQKEYSLISEKLNIPTGNLSKSIEKDGLYSINPVAVVENIPPEKAFYYQVAFQDLSGVEVRSQPIRKYDSSKGLSQVLGYIGKISTDELNNNQNYRMSDWLGKSGVEKTYEGDLKGISGQEQVEIDARGRLQRVIANIPSVQGNNLYLNIDYGVQEAGYNGLLDAAQKYGNGKGAAIALNPKDGSVYSLISLPDYDNNIFIAGDKNSIGDLFNNKDQPLLNRVISGEYPSGSTIKPVYATAALQENIISPSFAMDTPPEIRIGEFVFPDWKDHGKTDIKTAIAESNNIFFYALGGGWDKIKGLGIKKIEEWLLKFGFYAKTNIDLPSEAKGFVPNPSWKKEKKKEPWYIGDTYHLAIGQGDLSVTTVQLATAMSAIVNGGNLVTPHLGNKVIAADNKEIKKITRGVKSENIASQNNISTVKEGMIQTVESGSAQNIKDLTGLDGQKISSGGKTGTAQSNNKDKTHAWYVGFAPADDPQILVVVLVEEGGEGHTSAVPVAKEMLRAFFK